MLDIVRKTIDNFYLHRNYQLFREKCNRLLILPEELNYYVKQCKINLIEDGILEDDPSRIWFFYFNKYEKGEFEVKYRTILHISRVAPIFNIMHEFGVEHKNIDRIRHDLGYYSDNPYTKQQAALHNEISKILTQNEYVELKKVDMEEVVEGFQMPSDVTIFGKDITVELLLFRDVLDLCGRAARQRRTAKC